MKALTTSCRVLAGILLILFSLLTFINPFGIADPIKGYMLLINCKDASPLTNAMAIYLCVLELTMGVLFVTNKYKKLGASRILIGLLFIFSSIVKGVDPLGTTFKIEEYMSAFSMSWAQPLAFSLSVLLCTLEFLVGVLILTNACKKLGKWLLLLMMAFFLITTFSDAISNTVSDCGCFGDAIKLTNWETFWKNIVLLIPTLLIFFYQKTKHENWIFTKPRDLIILGSASIVMIGFCLYNYYNEPILDFRPWKVGTHIMAKESERGEVQSFVVYKNKQTGEEMEFLSAKLMDYYKDTAWVAAWEFKDSKVVDPNNINAQGFSMLDQEGNDHAKSIIGDANYTFIVATCKIADMPKSGIEKIKNFYKQAEEKGYHVVFLTSTLFDKIDTFKTAEPTFGNAEFYGADDKAIKTMIRSNPGLILMKNGAVLGKWHYRNIPDVNNIPFEKLAQMYNAD